jgi:hypothetical protein
VYSVRATFLPNLFPPIGCQSVPFTMFRPNRNKVEMHYEKIQRDSITRSSEEQSRSWDSDSCFDCQVACILRKHITGFKTARHWTIHIEWDESSPRIPARFLWDSFQYYHLFCFTFSRWFLNLMFPYQIFIHLHRLLSMLHSLPISSLSYKIITSNEASHCVIFSSLFLLP